VLSDARLLALVAMRRPGEAIGIGTVVRHAASVVVALIVDVCLVLFRHPLCAVVMGAIGVGAAVIVAILVQALQPTVFPLVPTAIGALIVLLGGYGFLTNPT
jgi:hypothetical protein